MSNKNYWQIAQRIKQQKSYIKKVYSYCNLDESSGIYVFYRVDSNKNKFAYVGQAKKLLTRINAHVNCAVPKSHIDCSIKTHGVATKSNFDGYKLRVYKCAETELNEKEKFFIQFYADHNYTLLNVESGGQDEGHIDLNYRKASKGYRDGLDKGKNNAIKEIAEMMKYLKIVPNQFKKNGEPTELAKRKLNEFKELLNGKDNNTMDSQND